MTDQELAQPPPVRLREETVEFLQDLRPEDLELLQGAISLVRSTRTLFRALKWLLGLFVGGVVMSATFGDALVKLKALWLK